MTTTTVPTKVIKALPKGQITIPADFREALGIRPETLLSVSLTGGHLEIVPLVQGTASLRRYAEEDLQRFLEEDVLDEATAAKVRALLGSSGA